MSNLEFNKIFAAILVAGIVGMLSGFIAEQFFHKQALEEDAFQVEALDDSAGGGAIASGPQYAEPVLAMIASADIAKGEKLSKACAACHSFEKGGPNKVGPNLWGVVNGPKAAHAGFTYSEAMASHSGEKWAYASLNQFLWKPKSYVDGTKMNFIGLKKPEDRAAIIAWLRTHADSPAALPSASDIAAEQAKYGTVEKAE